MSRPEQNSDENRMDVSLCRFDSLRLDSPLLQSPFVGPMGPIYSSVLSDIVFASSGRLSSPFNLSEDKEGGHDLGSKNVSEEASRPLSASSFFNSDRDDLLELCIQEFQENFFSERYSHLQLAFLNFMKQRPGRECCFLFTTCALKKVGSAENHCLISVSGIKFSDYESAMRVQRPPLVLQPQELNKNVFKEKFLDKTEFDRAWQQASKAYRDQKKDWGEYKTKLAEQEKAQSYILFYELMHDFLSDLSKKIPVKFSCCVDYHPDFYELIAAVMPLAPPVHTPGSQDAQKLCAERMGYYELQKRIAEHKEDLQNIASQPVKCFLNQSKNDFEARRLVRVEPCDVCRKHVGAVRLIVDVTMRTPKRLVDFKLNLSSSVTPVASGGSNVLSNSGFFAKNFQAKGGAAILEKSLSLEL